MKYSNILKCVVSRNIHTCLEKVTGKIGTPINFECIHELLRNRKMPV